MQAELSFIYFDSHVFAVVCPHPALDPRLKVS